MNKFKVGQTVVHLSHGVGVIKGIEEREFSPGNKTSFYIIEIHDNGAPKKVFVPLDAANSKLRSISDTNTLAKVTEYLKNGTTELNYQTWNRRYREYMELINSGNILDIAKAYVSLRELGNTDGLNFGERKMFEQARQLLVAEYEAAGTVFPERSGMPRFELVSVVDETTK